MKQVNINRLNSALQLLEMVPVRSTQEINQKVTAMQIISTVITDEAMPEVMPEAGKEDQHVENTAE